MMYRSAAFVAAMFSLVACGDKTPSGPNEPIKPVKIPPSVTLITPSKVEYAAKFVAVWQSQNAQACSAPWTARREVSGSDSVALTGSGWLPISCTGNGGTVTDSVYVEVSPPHRAILVRIKYVIPEGVTYQVPTVPLVLRNASRVDTILVKETASLTVLGLYADTVSFSIEGNTAYFPVEARVPKTLFQSAGTTDTISIVRIPREWTVEKGTHKGTRFAVSLIAAYDTAPDGGSFFSRSKLPNKEFGYERFGVLNTSLPFKLVLDHQNSPSPMTATDSMDLWNSVAVNELLYGRDLFMPAEKSTTSWNSSWNQAVANIDFITNASGGSMASPLNPLGVTGSVFTATSIGRFKLTGTIQHELIGHGFAFSHTCAWVSMMKSGCPPYPPGIIYPEPQKDVGYFELRLETDDARVLLGAKYHFGENLNGERKERGLVPEPIRYLKK
jgi:hypothetical protein